MPELDQLAKELEPKVGFLALSLEPDDQEVLQAAAELDLKMPVAIAQGEVLGPLSVNQVPSTIFVDREATIVAAASGERSAAFYAKRARALLSP